MGFFNDTDSGINGSSNMSDLIEFERGFASKLISVINEKIKYKAEQFGLKYDRAAARADVYSYSNEETIVICPEPLKFIKEFDDVSGNTAEANEMFLEKIKSFQRIKTDRIPEFSMKGEPVKIWINKTLSGINLRPGNLNEDPENFDPIRMSDDNVHGLIVGRTGSGKSVFINALILSLLTEYAPWELDLYLADFKKVELSRYMNNADEHNGNMAYTPHVNACAATSEIRYVISLIGYLVDCMKARQEFFARLGITKIQEFRKKYGVVLPRVLLIVDEFQQLFAEATNREAEEIQTMLNSITKLGRATGFHLIFASQEMSGTLRGNTLANFKIRMALPCDAQVSSAILGNSRAASLERGFVLINTENGDEGKNKKYRVPFIETDKSDNDEDEEKTLFYQFLDELKLQSRKYLDELKYKTSIQKFYREELQESESDFRNDLDRIRDAKNELINSNNALFDGIILGKSVLYSPMKNDKMSFYIERGMNKGVMIATPNPDDAARIRKLMAENLLRSDSETYHIGAELNGLVLERFRIDNAVKAFPQHKYIRWDADSVMDNIHQLYQLRLHAAKRIAEQNESGLELAKTYKRLGELAGNTDAAVAQREYISEKEQLESELNEVSAELKQFKKINRALPENPVVKFLAKCSTDVILPLPDKTKADFVNLNVYNDIVKQYASESDINTATKKNIEFLDKRITEAKGKGENNPLAELQSKMLKAALMFFISKDGNGDMPNLPASILYEFGKCYSYAEPLIRNYNAARKNLDEDSSKFSELTEKEESLRTRLNELTAAPDELTTMIEKAEKLLNLFFRSVFESALNTMGKRGRFDIPKVKLSISNGLPVKSLCGDNLDEAIKLCCEDILDRYLGSCLGNGSSQMFKKVVFWINGLDEIERLPNHFSEVIRNSVNQNILVVAIITSEMRDTTIRKAFDYSFVTGNVEKFYSMFEIKYTKQPLDSIVVNFGVRSKGLDVPFKMYKSNLTEIQAPDFIDRLLNE